MVTDYLFVVRHGESEANRKGIDAGTRDYHLTKKGIKEATFIAKAISKIKINAAYTSPVFRAVETAEIIASPHKLKVKTLEELTETKIKPEFLGKKGRHHILTTPEAFNETNKDLLDRTCKAIDIIKKEGEGNVIVVSHGDVIAAMLENVIERRVTTQNYYILHPDTAALSIVDVRDRPFLVLFNYHRKQFEDF